MYPAVQFYFIDEKTLISFNFPKASLIKILKLLSISFLFLIIPSKEMN